MKQSKILNAYLFISGIILSLVGSLTTFNPVKVKANEGIELAGNASALNDVRAFGTLLLATALFSLLGAFQASVRKYATLSVAILFTSLGIGRILSIVMDGMPSDGIVKATGLEMILGIAGIVLYSIYKEKQS